MALLQTRSRWRPSKRCRGWSTRSTWPRKERNSSERMILAPQRKPSRFGLAIFRVTSRNVRFAKSSRPLSAVMMMSLSSLLPLRPVLPLLHRPAHMASFHPPRLPPHPKKPTKGAQREKEGSARGAGKGTKGMRGEDEAALMKKSRGAVAGVVAGAGEEIGAEEEAALMKKSGGALAGAVAGAGEEIGTD